MGRGRGRGGGEVSETRLIPKLDYPTRDGMCFNTNLCSSAFKVRFHYFLIF